jgi:hypothetical protein
MDFLNAYNKPEIIVTLGLALVSLGYFTYRQIKFKRDQKKLYMWVKRNTNRKEFRTLKTIAGKNNFTLEEAEKLMSKDRRLRRGLGTEKDIWTIND